MPDLMPAPGSTATSAPSPIIFLTVSGTAATRGSPASVSAITATFMIPPTAAAYVRLAGNRFGAGNATSGQEIRHQDDDRDHDRHDDFHQCDEILVRLFVSGVIVARRCRVFDLAVIGHTIVSKHRTRCGRT